MSFFFRLSFLVSLSIATAAACGSNSSTSGSSATSSSSEAAGSTGTSTSSGAGAGGSTSSSTGSGGGGCVGPDVTACSQCCKTAHSGGYNEFDLVYATCICNNGSCAPDCLGTGCEGSAFNSMCVSCIKSSQDPQCKSPAQCSTTCQQFVACLEGCLG